MKNLDDKDKKILEMLLQDSRRPYHEIATEVGLSESTVRKRVIKLQEEGIIEKFTIQLKSEERDSVIAFITVMPVSEAEMKELLREMLLLPQCEEVFKLAGQCGVLVKLNVPSMIELNTTVELFNARSDVKSVERTCIVLDPIKSCGQNVRLL